MAKFKLKTHITFDCEKVTEMGALWTDRGHLFKKPGDWVINGELVMDDKTFRSIFEPADEEADALMNGDM